ncbi:MAG: hypothetical protein JW810_14710, partial [Sedimentisphaerales bacterium]|nr:hypothetical protein [Sedimentisphaerales bacterium]
MAKKKGVNEAAVGLTVLVAVALSVYILVVLGDWKNWLGDKQTITVHLPYEKGLKGLATGSPVYLGGAKIGKVLDAGVEAPSAEGRVQVFFVMQLPAQYRLYSNCTLAAESNMLGGQAMLSIRDLGHPDPDVQALQDGDTLTVEDMPGGISEVMETLRQELDAETPGSLLYRIKHELSREQADSLLASLLETMEHVRQIAVRVREEVANDPEKATLLAKVHEVADTLKRITAQIDKELQSADQQTAAFKVHQALDTLQNGLAQVEGLIADNRTPVTEAIASVRKTAGQLETDVPVISAKVQEGLDKLNTALDTALAALQEGKQLLATGKELVAENQETVNQIIRNLNEVGVNLKMASREVRLAPWKLLRKPDPGELEIQGLMIAAGSFAVGAERLEETVSRLRG